MGKITKKVIGISIIAGPMFIGTYVAGRTSGDWTGFIIVSALGGMILYAGMFLYGVILITKGDND